MKISIRQLKAKAAERPEGYVEEVLSKGIVSGDYLNISPEDYKALLSKYNPTGTMVTSSCCGRATLPPMREQIMNASKAAVRVLGAAVTGGKIMATEEVVKARQEICSKCEFWIEDRKRCTVCGCRTDLKLKMATEACPKGKWS